jgi:hypothetical protein
MALLVQSGIHLPERVLISLEVGFARLLGRKFFKLRSKVGLEPVEQITKHMSESMLIVREAQLCPWQDIGGIGVDKADVMREIEHANQSEI